jgi:hypothetical protein
MHSGKHSDNVLAIFHLARQQIVSSKHMEIIKLE